MFNGADFGFVGQSYQAPMTLQNAEDAINWYLEKDPTENPKMPNALLGTPGLNPVASTQLGQVRGLWVLPGSQTALAAVANVLYLVTIATQATATSIPTFAVAP